MVFVGRKPSRFISDSLRSGLYHGQEPGYPRVRYAAASNAYVVIDLKAEWP